MAYSVGMIARVRVAGLAGAIAIAALCTLGASTGPAAPQLSITIDDGRTTAATGDVLEYDIVVHNLGPADIKDLVLTQSVPAGLAFGSADPTGTHQGTKVIWPLGLKTASSGAFHSTMTVGTTPSGLLRMATVACVSSSATGAPIVCASHFDQLPAGTAAASQTGGSTGTSSGRGHIWWVAGGVALVIMVAAAILLVRRRRHARIDEPAEMADAV